MDFLCTVLISFVHSDTIPRVPVYFLPNPKNDLRPPHPPRQSTPMPPHFMLLSILFALALASCICCPVLKFSGICCALSLPNTIYGHKWFIFGALLGFSDRVSFARKGYLATRDCGLSPCCACARSALVGGRRTGDRSPGFVINRSRAMTFLSVTKNDQKPSTIHELVPRTVLHFSANQTICAAPYTTNQSTARTVAGIICSIQTPREPYFT